MALNPSVTGITNVGRVVGNNMGTASVSGNSARSDMDITSVGTRDDGADITVSGIGTSNTTVFSSANGWSTSVWIIPPGSLSTSNRALPRLRVFGGTHMPVLPLP